MRIYPHLPLKSIPFRRASAELAGYLIKKSKPIFTFSSPIFKLTKKTLRDTTESKVQTELGHSTFTSLKKKKIVKTLLKFFKIETLEDLSREFCSEYFDSKVKNGDMRELLIEGFNKAYGKITFSPNLNECPINLVLKLSFLRNQCGALTRSYHFNDWQ